MKMKEHFWPAEQERRPSPLRQAFQVAAREFKRELARQKQAEKAKSIPDPFKK